MNKFKAVKIDYIEKRRKNLINNVFSKKERESKIFKLSKLFIYLNFIIVYFILLKLYKKINRMNSNIYIKDKKITTQEIDYDSILKKRMRATIDWPLPNEIKYKPLMKEEAIKAFSYLMKPENIYFEFGSGGSTNLASYYKVKTYSVESNVNWHKQLKNAGVVAEYITIDLNSKNLGRPGPGTTIEDWKKYFQAYKREYNADIILIDGVFRVACAFDIFPKIRDDTIILVHDYNKTDEYLIMEKYYTRVKMFDCLAVFFKKPNIDSIPEYLYNKYSNIIN